MCCTVLTVGKWHMWNTLGDTSDIIHAVPTITLSILRTSVAVHSFIRWNFNSKQYYQLQLYSKFPSPSISHFKTQNINWILASNWGFLWNCLTNSLVHHIVVTDCRKLNHTLSSKVWRHITWKSVSWFNIWSQRMHTDSAVTWAV
jgi:hypothetical protein